MGDVGAMRLAWRALAANMTREWAEQGGIPCNMKAVNVKLKVHRKYRNGVAPIGGHGPGVFLMCSLALRIEPIISAFT